MKGGPWRGGENCKGREGVPEDFRGGGDFGLIHSCQAAKTKSRDTSVKKCDFWVKSRDISI